MSASTDATPTPLLYRVSSAISGEQKAVNGDMRVTSSVQVATLLILLRCWVSSWRSGQMILSEGCEKSSPTAFSLRSASVPLRGLTDCSIS